MAEPLTHGRWYREAVHYDAAEGRPGTYTVHLEHPSYTWDTSGVVVLSSGEGCPVLGTQVEARLAPIE